MQAPRRPRTRVRITDTLALGLDQFLESRGQRLDRPQEIRDSVLRGLVLRRETSGLKTWHYGYSFSGRRGRVKIGNCPALSVKGARKSEALSLRRKDLDFELELINVPGEIAKNRQSRSVPMQPDNKECLTIWLGQTPNGSPDDLVFPSRRGVRIKRICAAWKKLMRMAQITNFRVHDTRHDYASRLAMAEVSLKTIAELLGHEDLTQVQ